MREIEQRWRGNPPLSSYFSACRSQNRAERKNFQNRGRRSGLSANVSTRPKAVQISQITKELAKFQLKPTLVLHQKDLIMF